MCAESAAPPFILVAGSGSPYELDQVGHPQARARLPRASTRALLNAAHKNAQETQPSRRRSVSVVLSPRSPAVTVCLRNVAGRCVIGDRFVTSITTQK